ncbi:MAG TPA: 1-acyl-sn-glycerol-3-phosphate acyltransferase [Brumimicrobium sp.]|nr:1-acyl-sn-glycerol-3-phosphate acyltransferase [Brumimicrobium sp.]
MKDSEKIIDIEKVIHEKNPKLLRMLPRFVLNYLKRILHEDDVNAFIFKHKNDNPLEFSQAVMKKFNIQLEHEGLENIPADGGAIIAMNHPWGGMDAMALIAVAYDKRPDLKFIVNDILMHLENLNSIFVGVNKFSKNGKNSLQSVEQTFAGDDLLCIFPAGLVSRKVKGEVVDLTWKKTFVTRSIKYDKIIIPTYIDGRLSNFFYRLSNIRKKLGIKVNIEMLFLVNELYKQHNKKITIKFGRPIQASTLDNSKSHAKWAEVIKDRVYQLKD